MRVPRTERTWGRTAIATGPKKREEISKNKGVRYDPEVIAACLRLFVEGGFEFEN